LSVLTLVLALLVCRKLYVVLYDGREAQHEPGSELKGRYY
jgi:hypothetical protein